jgi:pilus assembly protein CpaF
MGLRDRFLKLKDANVKPEAPAPAHPSATPVAPKSPDKPATDPYQELKSRIHRKLIESLDLSALDSGGDARLRNEIRLILTKMIETENVFLTPFERERLIQEIQNETFGLGPLEPLLHDPQISDILVNGHRRVYVERYGRLEKANVVFRDDAHLMQIIDRIVSKVGRRIDESSPMVDARLPDGSRVNAIIPPLALDGPMLSIRRFAVEPFKMNDLIEFGTLTNEIAVVLEGAVKARLNLLISGGTGAGKSTLLNVLSEYIPNTERIVTIEDSAELQLKQMHVVRLETRPPNVEGKGGVTQRELLRNSLRMRPDRIIIGEVRGAESLDMLQAMNTGHEGSISTIHANSPRDALHRLGTMVMMAGMELPERAIKEQVASAIHVVIQLARLSDGTRKLVRLSEIVGMEGDVITMQDLFSFEKSATTPDGRVLGRFKSTGFRPRFLDRFSSSGVDLPKGLFSGKMK